MKINIARNPTPGILSAFPWLAAARMAWVIFLILTSILVMTSIPARLESLTRTANVRALLELGISVRSYTLYVLTLNLGVGFAHLVIAAIIFWRRPDDWMALLLAYALVANGAMIPLESTYRLVEATQLVRVQVNLVTYISLITGSYMLYLFPDGRFVPSWTRYLAVIWTVLGIFTAFFPDSALSLLSFPAALQVLVLLFWAAGGISAQVYRFVSVSSPLQRQQTKWAVLGLAAAVLGPFAFFLPNMLAPALGDTGASNMLYQRVGGSFFTIGFMIRMAGLAVIHLGLLLFPLSFAIAILRYRLWEIDLLINRAMVYTALTGSLALVYFSSIILLQTTFRAFTGQDRSVFVTVISTLLMVVLISPLRQRIQLSIDRRFYRRRYDAQKTLAAFSETMRDEVDLQVLSSRLQAVVEESIQPSLVVLWLKSEGESSAR